MSNDFKRLSAPEALRAIYIDFEGGKGKRPVLLGVHRRGGGPKAFVHWVAVDRAFASLVGSSLSLHDAVENVVKRAEKGDRRIVSWSEHDLRVVRLLRDEDPGLVARFEARFANARGVADRWRDKIHAGDKPERGRLDAYLEWIHYSVPEEAASGSVGETIRRLRPWLERGLAITPVQQARWSRLLEHNRHDCAGMRRVCLQATRELDAAA
jgi:hypothetical protein